MSPRRGVLRALVFLWAACQLALPGVAALAEGLASRTSVHATAHVESRTEGDCVRVHEADCVFCQFLSSPAAPGREFLALRVARTETLAELRSTPPARASALRGAAGPRAPPLV